MHLLSLRGLLWLNHHSVHFCCTPQSYSGFDLKVYCHSCVCFWICTLGSKVDAIALAGYQCLASSWHIMATWLAQAAVFVPPHSNSRTEVSSAKSYIKQERCPIRARLTLSGAELAADWSITCQPLADLC